MDARDRSEQVDKTPSTGVRSSPGDRIGAQLRLEYAMGTHQYPSARHPSVAAVRDRELVTFVARLGVVAIGHVMAAMGVGRTAAYRRVAVLTDAGLLERRSLLRGCPALIRATREGLRYAGLGALPVAAVRPGGADHWLRCADVALRLEKEFGAERGRVLAERELMLWERTEGRSLASARLSSHGRETLHRPDLAVVRDDATIAVEVELSVKAPRRLEQIVRAWRRAEHVDEVRYLCAPGAVRRGVERAVEKTYAVERVRVEELAL